MVAVGADPLSVAHRAGRERLLRPLGAFFGTTLLWRGYGQPSLELRCFGEATASLLWNYVAYGPNPPTLRAIIGGWTCVVTVWFNSWAADASRRRRRQLPNRTQNVHSASLIPITKKKEQVIMMQFYEVLCQRNSEISWGGGRGMRGMGIRIHFGP